MNSNAAVLPWAFDRRQMRQEREAERVSLLGPRVLLELLTEIGERTGQPDQVAAVLADFARLTPEVARAVGADRFPPRLVVIPMD